MRQLIRHGQAAITGVNPHQGNKRFIVSHRGKKGGGAVEIEYLLLADFVAGDVVLAAGDLGAQAPGAIAIGALNVHLAGSGVVEIENNQLIIDPASAWNQAGVLSPAALAMNTGGIFKWTAETPTVSATTPAIGLRGNTTDVNFAAFEQMYRVDQSTLKLAYGSGVFVAVWNLVYTANVPWQGAVLYGGRNALVPIDTGDDPTSFENGGALYYHDGTNWLLHYTYPLASTEIINVTGLGTVRAKFDTLRVAASNSALLPLLIPTTLVTPVVGGEPMTHAADCYIEAHMTVLPTAGDIEIEFRKQDASNYWIYRLSDAGNQELVEVVAGAPTVRANFDGAFLANNRFVLNCIDEKVRFMHRDNVGFGAEYLLAVNFKTATGGLVTIGSGTLTHVASWPMGSGGEYSEMERY